METERVAEKSLKTCSGVSFTSGIGLERQIATGGVGKSRRVLDKSLKASSSVVLTFGIGVKGLKVESRCGAVALGRVCLLPPLSSDGALVT